MKLSSLDQLDYTQLAEIRDRCQELMNQKRANEIELIRAELRSRAEALGIDEKELLGSTKTQKMRLPSTGPEKYRNPETGEVWAGRSRGMPDWMKDPIDEGLKKKEDFINPDWLAAKKKV